MSRDAQFKSNTSGISFDRFDVLDNLLELVVVQDTEQRVLWANRAALQSLGLTSQEQVVGRYCYDLWACGCPTCTQCPVVESHRTGQPARGSIESPDGRVWQIRANPVRDDEGRIVGVVETCLDVTERVRAEQALHESQRTLSTLIGNLPGVAYRCANEPDWPMQFISSGCLAVTGYTDKQFYRGQVQWGRIIHPEDRAMVWDVVQQAMADPRPFTLEYRIRTRGGDERWVWEQGCGVYDEEGTLLTLEGFITDITRRKRAEAELRRSEADHRRLADHLRTLLNELDHRVKNNLAHLSALLDLYGRSAESIEQFADNIRAKLMAMRWVHTIMAAHHWKSVELRELLRRIAEQYEPPNAHEHHLTMNGPAIAIPPRQVGPLAMIVQELFANAGKHGVYRKPHGAIDITWTADDGGEHDNQHLRLTWQERNNPTIQPPKQKRGVGLELIDGFARFELRGTCQQHFEPPGLRFELHARLDPPNEITDIDVSPT